MRDMLELMQEFDGAEVLAMRKEYYIGSTAGEEMFDEEPCTDVKYSILVKESNPRGLKAVFTLSESLGWCGSGYTTASYADISMKILYEDFGPFTHIPAKPSERLHFSAIGNDAIESNYFSYGDWGDEYYPAQFASVKEEMFAELPRAFKERPVWIFRGPSCLGKSTLGLDLKAQGREVYETDSSADLPDVIYADIIVLGGKYHFTIGEIKERLFETKNVIFVDFSKGGENGTE